MAKRTRKICDSSLEQVNRADDALYKLYALALRGLPLSEWDTARELLHEIEPVINAVQLYRQYQRFHGQSAQTQSRFDSTLTAEVLRFFGE